MKRAQGNTRSNPDGFLHIQNFTVTKASGAGGLIWQLFDDHQKGIVESVMIERAVACDANKYFGVEAHHFKHGQWRFRKSFLKANFTLVVLNTCRVCKISPTQLLADQIEYLGGI